MKHLHKNARANSCTAYLGAAHERPVLRRRNLVNHVFVFVLAAFIVVINLDHRAGSLWRLGRSPNDGLGRRRLALFVRLALEAVDVQLRVRRHLAAARDALDGGCVALGRRDL
jgi:hypothetical protein